MSVNKITPKIKIIHSTGFVSREKDINDFLSTLDVRQIVKISDSRRVDDPAYYHTTILYINFEDIRDLKIDTILSNGHKE